MTIQQAVILAGGRGTRLRPSSDLRPKPLIQVAGRPFLEHLVQLLGRSGISRVLILTGYEAQEVENTMGDGSRLGVSISYNRQPEHFETGARLAAALPQLEDRFLLLYSDNICPLRLPELESRLAQPETLGVMTVYTNEDGYSRDNVRVQDGRVEAYDRSRTAPDLAGVDIGFVALRKEVLSRIPEGNPSFEAHVYPQLVEEGALGAVETEHRYYSIGDYSRLAATERYLGGTPTILLDRDGTLNVRQPRARYVESWDDWSWLPGALDALVILRQQGVRVLVITNQPGIGKGVVSLDSLHEIHRRMARDAAEAGGYIEAVYFCPHDWDEGCRCRKPAPGMLFQAQKDYCLNLSETLFVGDDDRDGEAAAAAGCPFEQVDDARTLLQVVSERFHLPGDPAVAG
ncbi:MAG: HAD-IIIA family hydrolase [Gemmatimonadota bacterium]